MSSARGSAYWIVAGQGHGRRATATTFAGDGRGCHLQTSLAISFFYRTYVSIPPFHFPFLLQVADAARATLGLDVAACVVTSRPVGVTVAVSQASGVY